MKQRNAFLKSIGLEVPFIFGRGRGQGEAPKRVIDTDRRLAFARCGVHILPVSVCILLISLNCKHVYLGRTLPGSIMDPSINIALLQVAAKLQELAMVASLTTIVIHVLRSELIDGEGIPLGLLGAGFMFTASSYFWSPEFWGSTHVKYRWITRLKIYGILVLAGIIASFAGPSTAVLLIPEDQLWNVGRTYIYPPGTQDDWSPVLVQAETSHPNVNCNVPNATDTVVCPSGGFSALWNSRSSLNVYKKASSFSNQTNITTVLDKGMAGVGLPSPMSLLPDIEITTTFRSIACETSASSPRLVEPMYSRLLMDDWRREAYALPYAPFKYGPSHVEYKYHGMIGLEVDSVIPSLRVACASAQSIGVGKQTALFPRLPEDGCWTTAQSPVLDVETPSLLLPTKQIKSSWLTLPSELGNTSAGFILQLPSGEQSDSRSVVTCSIDARWVNGTVHTLMPRYMSGSSYMDDTFGSVRSKALLKAKGSDHFGQSDFSPFLPVMTSPLSIRMTLTEPWLQQLTPVLPKNGRSYGYSDLNTLEALLIDIGILSGLQSESQTAADIWNTEMVGVVNRTVALEWWLAVFLTDGLARRGSVQALNTTGPVESWGLLSYDGQPGFGKKLLSGKPALVKPSPGAVQKEVSITIGGYSYQANSITDWAAVALLISYVLLAVSHSIYCIRTGRTSGAWDTLTELLILVQNSPKAPEALRNANAGVKDIATYSRRARVFSTTTTPREEKSVRNVELIFDDAETAQQSVTNNLDHSLERASTAPQLALQYVENPTRHDRAMPEERSISRDEYESVTSNASHTISLERFRSHSGGSQSFSSSTSTISPRPVLGKVRPGVVYGHSAVVIPTRSGSSPTTNGDGMRRRRWFAPRARKVSESRSPLL